MTKPLARARALIAKAIDPVVPEEEARSLALIACKLIAEHKLLGDPAKDDEPEQAPPGHVHVDLDPLEAFWEVFVRATGMPGGPFPGRRTRPPGAPYPPPPGPGRPPPPPPQPHNRPSRRTGDGADHARRGWRPVEPTYPQGEAAWWDRLPCELYIYASRPCEVCGKPCDRGELVWAFAVSPGTDPQDGHVRPSVAHLIGCRDKLPLHQRRPRAR